jgi:hypothetical protein
MHEIYHKKLDHVEIRKTKISIKRENKIQKTHSASDIRMFSKLQRMKSKDRTDAIYYEAENRSNQLNKEN